MNRLTELLEDLAHLENRTQWAKEDDVSLNAYQIDMSLFQAKLGHEEVAQLTRIANYMAAYHDIAITHASELSQKLDALWAKVQGLEAVVDEQIMGVIHRIAEDVKQLPPEQTKEEIFAAMKQLIGSGYEDTQRYEKKEDIK